MKTNKATEMVFDEDCYDTFPKKNREFATQRFRYGYSSMVTPRALLEVEVQQARQEHGLKLDQQHGRQAGQL